DSGRRQRPARAARRRRRVGERARRVDQRLPPRPRARTLRARDRRRPLHRGTIQPRVARCLLRARGPERAALPAGPERPRHRPALKAAPPAADGARVTIRVGVLGYGYWGPNLARNIAETDGLCLAAIADERADRRAAAARRHAGVAVADSAASTIDADRIDAVVIATPLSTHFPLARAAIEASTHVLVEKPLAASRPEAETA